MVDIARFLAQRPAPPPRASDVSAELARHIQSLIQDLLPASKRMSGTLAVGSVAGERGQSLRVQVSGPRRGRWADYATGECGDALDLVAAVLFNGDLRRAYGWALNWLGIDTVCAPVASPNGARRPNSEIMASKPNRQRLSPPQRQHGRRRSRRLAR